MSQSEEPTEIEPVYLEKMGVDDPYDFRPRRWSEEEPDPKASSAPELATSSLSDRMDLNPESSADPAPAEKDSPSEQTETQPQATPEPASSTKTSDGSSEPPA